MSHIPAMDRRHLLRTLGALGIGGALGTVAATSVARPASAAPAGTAPCSPEQLRFDLTAAGRELFRAKPLHNKTVIQSLAFDNQNRHVYAVQLMAGGQRLPGEAAPVSGATRARDGDLCLTKLDLDGNELGYMFLTGFGHGVQIGVEPVGGSAFLWTEVDSVPDDGTNGWGTRICRFRFTDGAVLTPESSEVRRFTPLPGVDRTTCNIDPATNRLVMRYRRDGAFRFGLFDLDQVRRNVFTPLADVAQPTITYPFQGYASYGGYLYLLEGSSYGSTGSTPPIGNTHLTCVDWATGAVVQRQLVTDGDTLPFREPEGLAIQLPDPRRPDRARLCFGFASTTSPTDTAKLASVLYKDVLVTPS